MKTSEMPETTCPVCKIRLDRATSVNGEATPDVGDITVCIGCGTRLEINPDFTYKVLTREELNKLAEEEPAKAEELHKLQLAIIENLK